MEEREVTFRVATGNLNPSDVKVMIDIDNKHQIEAACFKTVASVWSTSGQITLPKKQLKYRYKFSLSNRSIKSFYAKRSSQHYVETTYRQLLPCVDNYRDIIKTHHTTLSSTDIFHGLKDHFYRLLGSCTSTPDVAQLFRELEQMWPTVEDFVSRDTTNSIKLKEWVKSTMGLYSSQNREQFTLTLMLCVIYGKLAELVPGMTLQDASPAVNRSDCWKIVKILQNINPGVLTDWCKDPLQITINHLLQVLGMDHWLYVAAYFPNLFNKENLEESKQGNFGYIDSSVMEKKIIPNIVDKYDIDFATELLKEIPNYVFRETEKATINSIIRSFTSAMHGTEMSSLSDEDITMDTSENDRAAGETGEESTEQISTRNFAARESKEHHDLGISQSTTAVGGEQILSTDKSMQNAEWSTQRDELSTTTTRTQDTMLTSSSMSKIAFETAKGGEGSLTITKPKQENLPVIPVSSQNTNSTPMAIQDEKSSIKSSVTFHVLVREKDVAHVTLMMRPTDQSTIVSKHDMELSVLKTDHADGNWVHAATTLEMCLDKEYRYRYSVTKTTWSFLSGSGTSIIDENFDRSFATYDVIHDTFRLPDMSKEEETERIAKRLYISIFLLFVTHTNFKEFIIQMERIGFPGRNNKQLVKETCEWINYTVTGNREAVGNYLTDIQLIFLAVVLAKVIRSTKNMKPYEKIMTADFFHQIVPPMQHLSADEFPTSVKYEELEYLCIVTVNSTNGNWLHVWQHFFNLLDLKTIDSFASKRFVDMPKLICNTWDEDRKLTVGVLQMLGDREEAIGTLFSRLIRHAKDIQVIKGFLELYQQSTAYRNEDKTLQSLAARKIANIIESRYWIRNLRRLEVIWQMFCQTSPIVAETVRVLITKHLSDETYELSDLEPLRRLLLNNALFRTADELMRVLQNLMKQQDTAYFQDTLIQMLECTLLMEPLAPQQVKMLITEAIQSSRPWMYHSNPRKQAYVIQRLYRTVGITCRCQHLDIDDLRERVKAMAFNSTKSVSLAILLKALSNRKTQFLQTEELSCLSEHIQYRLRGDKTTKASVYHLKHLQASSGGNISVESKQIRDVLFAMIDTQDNTTSTFECEQSITKLEAAVAKILQNGQFWLMILQSSGLYSKDLEQHSCSKAVIEILKLECSMMKIGRVTPGFLQMLQKQQIEPLFDIVALTLPTYQNDFTQWKRDQKNLTAMAETFHQRIDHLNRLFDGCLYHLQQDVTIEDMKPIAIQLKRCLIVIEKNAGVTLQETAKPEFWGLLYDFIPAANKLHGLAFSSVFLNICRSVFNRSCPDVLSKHPGSEELFAETTSNIGASDILDAILHKDPITTNDLLTVLMQHCLPLFSQHCQIFISGNLSVPASVVSTMTKGISDMKELEDEIQKLEAFFAAKVPGYMTVALKRHVEFSLLRKRSEQLADIFSNFDIPDENDDMHNAITKINGLLLGNVTLEELDKAIKTVSVIETSFNDEEWEIIEQLARSKELISFLKLVVDEDLRNLIDAVEERSEQSVDEAIVSDLIDVQRYMKPLLKVHSGRKLIEAISKNRTLARSVKKLPHKLDSCVSNVHSLKDLYDNVANRGEMTKGIVSNTLQCGIYSFKMDESSNVCRVVLSYFRGDSEARYGLDDLNDLRSRALLLVNTRKDSQYPLEEHPKSASPTPNLQEFVSCITTVNDIVDLCSWLVNSGHFQFTNFSKNVTSLTELEGLRTVLRQKYDHWRKILDEARQKYYFLNFIHSKRLLQLDQFITEDNSLSYDIRLLFKYINSAVEVDESLRLAYDLPNDMNDLKSRVFALGSALQEIFGQQHPVSRPIPGNISVQKSTTNTKVYPGKVFVAVLDECKSLKSISTMLRLYNNTTGLIPEPSQVIMCQQDTPWVEIDLFLRRCVGASANLSRSNLYTLVNVELLPLETQFQLVTEVTKIQRSHDSHYLLAMICRGGNHHIVDEFSPQFTHRIQGMTDADMKTCLHSGWTNVEIVTSSRAGLGKSEYVKNQASRRSRGVSTLTVSGPVTKQDLVQQIQQQQMKAYEILHIDVAPVSDPYLLDCFLFELIVIGMAVSGTHMCMIPTTDVAVEIANTQEDTLRNSLTTLFMFKGEHLKWNNFEDYVVSMDINSPVQVGCHYLQMLKSHTLDTSDIILTGPNKNVNPLPATECRGLLQKYIGNQEVLTFAIVDTFLGIFAQELRRMSASHYFTIQSLKDMLGTNDVRSQFLKAVMDISREFSSPSVQRCEKGESGQEQSVSLKHIDTTVTASKMVDRLHGMVKWADSNHLLVVFHRQDSQTVTPLYRLKSQVPDNVTKLFEYQMKKELSDYKILTQNDLQSTLEKIVRSTRRKFDQAKLEELQTNYALTPDNLLKMVLIHMRINSRIPVVIMGETGCGKTTLITYLARVCEAQFSTLNIHAGVTQSTILDFVESLQYMTEKNLNQEVWGFLDEINTCDHLGLLNEIICRHTCRGKELPHNLVFLAACNPYRLREYSSLSVGLEGQIKRDELSKLVYRVHPLPEAMMDYVWDFGSLDRKDEEAYIRRMLETTDTILIDMIIMSQSFMRVIEKTSYCVSLRDVNRCHHLFKWFKQMINMKGAAKVHGIGHTQLDQLETRSVILALAHCYHSRLTQEADRKKYRTNIALIFRTSGVYNVYEEDIERIIKAEQLDLLKRMQLPPGTAKNEALRENVFVILVSIMNRLPVFVVGKPGCSKSLSMQLIRSNLRGGDSRDEYFRKLPAVYVVSHQGSESSTSEGIIKVFEKAKNYKKANPDVMPVVLLDEIGLAEASSFNPLKVLHSQLEPTVGGFPPVAVVGISNWTLDAAKMNRAIHLSRPEPTVKDLADTAKSIRDDCEENKTGSLMHYHLIDDDKLFRLANAYSEYQLSQTHKNFHGLRDYYSFVKFVATESLQHIHSEPGRIIQTGLLRNFGGLKLEMNHILKKFSDSMSIIYNPEVHPSVQELIKSNLEDPNARHLMVITSGDSALNILEETLRDIDFVTIFGSKFEQDYSEEYNYRILSDIILCMERGDTLILRDLESIYGSLYDMLNQNYTVVGKKRSCRVAHGAYSNPMCQVHEAFRCVVLVDEKDVDYQNPPFLNRFEKQTLRFADVLDGTQKEVIEYLDKWQTDISFIEGHHFSPDEMFIGLHDDTLPSLVCYQSNNKDIDEESDLKTRCIDELMNVASPEAVLRISNSTWGKEYPVEVEELKRRYFSQPLFTGLKCLLESRLVESGEMNDNSEEQMNGNLEHFCSRLVLYTHSSVHTDVKKCVGSTFITQVEKLSNFKSERHLRAQLRHFWMESDKNLLIVQCIPSVDSEHMLLTKCKIDEYRQEYLASVGQEGMCKHVIMIVYIKREDREERKYTWQFNFLCGWEQFTLDTLESRTPVLLDLLEETISSHLSRGTIKLEVIIEELILWCFSCNKYDSHFREVDDVVSLAGSIAQSKMFKAYLKKRVLKYIQSKETVSIQESDNNWQVAVACNRDLLFRCSSLVGAMLEYITSYVRQPLARCIASLEMCNAWAGSPVSPDVDDETAEFWQICFDHSEVLNINSDELPQKFAVESCIVECPYLQLKFPFFNVFHRKIEEQRVWLMAQDVIKEAMIEDPGDKIRALTERLKDIINSMEAFKSGEYICSHMKQFCDDLYNTFSFEYAPQLPCEIRLEVMKCFMKQLGTSVDQIGEDPIYHIANVYANLWTNAELLQAKVQLVAIYGEISGKEIHELLLSGKPAKSQQETEVSDGLSVKSDDSDSEDTNEHILVTEICKCMLPSQGTLQRIGSIESWQQQANLLMILASKVCNESEILQFLRLCLEFVSRLSNKFTECKEYLISIVNLAKEIENPLESEEVFDFIVEKISKLQRKGSIHQNVLALEEFLGIYFGLCLEVNVDSPLRPRIMQTLCKMSGDLIVGSRHVLLALLKSDINQNQEEDYQVCEQLIQKGKFDEESFPNLAFIDEILQQNTADCHLAALCCDVVEEVAFQYITAARLGTIASEDHQILITATEAVRVIQIKNAGCLRLVVSTAYIRAFTKAAAELLHGKTIKSFKEENAVFANVLNGLLQIKDETMHGNVESSIKMRLLKCLREHKALYQLQTWCDDMADSLTSMCEMKWQTVLLPSRLGYNPLAYVDGYTKAVDAIKRMQNDHNKHNIQQLITSARYNSRARIALLAAIAEMYYFIQTTGGSRVTDKVDIQWLYDQTIGYTDTFRDFVKRLLGLVDFNGIMQIGEATSPKELEKVSVVIHLMTIVVAYANENEQPALLTMMTNATALHNMYIPSMGDTYSCFNNAQGVLVKSSFCPCGLALVENCQRNTARCPVCKRKRQPKEICPLKEGTPTQDIKGFSHYDLEANSTETVRDLSLAAFRIIQLLIHCSLLGGHSIGFLSEDELLSATNIASIPGSVATFDKAKASNDSNADDQLHIVRMLDKDWRLLEDITSSNHENVTLLLHSVIHKCEDHIRLANRFLTIQQRNNWEKLISERVDEQIQGQPFVRSQFKRVCLNAQGVPDSCLETQIEELDATNKTHLRRLFRNTRNQSFSDFQFQFVVIAAKHQFLRVFFHHHDRLQFLQYLPALLNWNKHIIKTLNHKIRRVDANQTMVRNFLESVCFFLDKAAKVDARATFEKFQEAWNSVREGWAISTGEKAQFSRMTSESRLSDCIIDACAKQNPLREMINTLQSIQNEFLMETMAVACSEHCPALSFLMRGEQMAGLKHSHLNHAKGAIISYQWSDSILVCSDINTEYGSGTDINYNYGIIEDKLARKLVLNKAILTDGETFTQFAFADDLTHACSKILAEIKQSIRQEPLTDDLITIIKSEQERRQTFAKDFLKHLEVILVLLKKAKGDSESSLEDYIKRWSTHLPNSFPVDLLPEPKDSFKLHHIVHLYEVLEDQLVDKVDDTLNDSFRQPIPDEVKRTLTDKLKPCAIERLESITSLISRFIFRYLRSEVDDTVYKTGLSELMDRYAGSTMDFNAVFELLPDELAVEHVVKALEVIKDHIKKQREVELMKNISPNLGHPQKGGKGKKKRRGNVLTL